MELAAQLGNLLPPTELPAAVIDAHRGRVDDARARAQGAVDRAEAQQIRVAQSGHGWVLGFVELSLGDAAAALPFLARAYELRNDFLLEPGMRLELGDFSETLIAVGQLDEADEVLATWQERADALDRAWALAILARCRGLLQAARGDLEGAFASFEHALEQHARTTDPFQRARTLLALGRTERRAKRAAPPARPSASRSPSSTDSTRRSGRSRPARSCAGSAAARPRAASCRRVSSVSRPSSPRAGTNKEVAAALFLAERTVASHLTRVYAKLGVRSRSELTLRLAESGAQAPPTGR